MKTNDFKDILKEKFNIKGNIIIKIDKSSHTNHRFYFTFSFLNQIS